MRQFGRRCSRHTRYLWCTNVCMYITGMDVRCSTCTARLAALRVRNLAQLEWPASVACGRTSARPSRRRGDLACCRHSGGALHGLRCSPAVAVHNARRRHTWCRQHSGRRAATWRVKQRHDSGCLLGGISSGCSSAAMLVSTASGHGRPSCSQAMLVAMLGHWRAHCARLCSRGRGCSWRAGPQRKQVISRRGGGRCSAGCWRRQRRRRGRCEWVIRSMCSRPRGRWHAARCWRTSSVKA